MTKEDRDHACRLLIATFTAFDAAKNEDRQAAFERAKGYVKDLALSWGVAVDW